MPGQEQTFAYVAYEYISLKQPGKALIILKEGLSRRQLLSKRLTDLALKSEKMTSSLDNIVEYFQKVRWIFILDADLYKQYLQQLKVEILKDPLLCNKHGDPELITLHDEDLAQIVF